MDYPESVLVNGTHKLLWDIEIQTDHLILARRPDLLIDTTKKKQKKPKKTRRILEFVVLVDHKGKTERQYKER